MGPVEKYLLKTGNEGHKKRDGIPVLNTISFL
jgi:hypothetical protein